MKVIRGLFLGLGMVTFLAIQNIRAEDDAMGGMGAAAANGTAPMAPSGGTPAPAMGGMMGMMDGMMNEMGMAPKPGPAMMGKMAPTSGMASMPSTLPAVPGTLHIYHVGATGFFLDYAKKIGLTSEQQAAINPIKKQALQRRADFQQKSVQGEQQLWALTDSDVPDAALIQAKLGEIEKLRADMRYDFINSVGEAAKVLTDHQRQMVVKTTSSMKSM